ncbi:MAG TPA: S1 RNA-binding domain-containing protein [Ardenticatenaceae bacterium]
MSDVNEAHSSEPMDPETDAGNYELRRDTARELTERILGDPEEARLAEAIRDANETAGLVGGNDQNPWVGGDLDEVSVGSVAAPDEEKRWSELVQELDEPGTRSDDEEGSYAAIDTPLYSHSAAATATHDAPLAREVPLDTESELGHVPSLDNTHTSTSFGAPAETLVPGPGEDTAPLAPDNPTTDFDDFPSYASTATLDEELPGDDANDAGGAGDDAGATSAVSDTATVFTQEEDAAPAAPAAQAAPAEDTAPVAQDAPAEESAPVAQDAPAEEAAPVAQEAPAEEPAPVAVAQAASAPDDETPTTVAPPNTADDVRAAANDDVREVAGGLGPQVTVSEPMGMRHNTADGENANPIDGATDPIPQSIGQAEGGIESLPPALEMKLQGTTADTDPMATAEIAPLLSTTETTPEETRAPLAEEPATAPQGEATGATEGTGEGGEATGATEGTGEGEPKRRRRRRGGGGRQGRKLETFTAGEELQGTVRSVQPYGAFIDVGAERDGLVHISELKDGFVEKVEDVVKEGDTVTVRIKEVDVESGRLSLTMRAPRPAREERPASEARPAATEAREGEEPGQERTEGEPREPRRERRERREGGEGDKRTRLRDLTEGQEVTGTVTSVVDFGAFVNIGATTDGLIHISELSEDRVNRVSDVVQEGQEVTVRILEIDKKRNRISLSMKPQPEAVDYGYDEDEGGDENIETPSVMELAFARARERNRKDRPDKKANKQQREEVIDDIIERTLRQDLT